MTEKKNDFHSTGVKIVSIVIPIRLCLHPISRTNGASFQGRHTFQIRLSCARSWDRENDHAGELNL